MAWQQREPHRTYKTPLGALFSPQFLPRSMGRSPGDWRYRVVRVRCVTYVPPPPRARALVFFCFDFATSDRTASCGHSPLCSMFGLLCFAAPFCGPSVFCRVLHCIVLGGIGRIIPGEFERTVPCPTANYDRHGRPCCFVGPQGCNL